MRLCDLKYFLPPLILIFTASYYIHKRLLRRGAGATSVAACSTCLEGTYSNGTGAQVYWRYMKCFVLWIMTWSWTQILLGLDGWFSHTICIHIVDQNRIVFFKLANESLFAGSSMLHPHLMYIDVVILDVLLTVYRRRECRIGVFVRRVSGWDVLDWTRSNIGGQMCNFEGTICDDQFCICVLLKTISCIYSSYCAQKWFACILTITFSPVTPAGSTALNEIVRNIIFN